MLWKIYNISVSALPDKKLLKRPDENEFPEKEVCGPICSLLAFYSDSFCFRLLKRKKYKKKCEVLKFQYTKEYVQDFIMKWKLTQESYLPSGKFNNLSVGRWGVCFVSIFSCCSFYTKINSKMHIFYIFSKILAQYFTRNTQYFSRYSKRSDIRTSTMRGWRTLCKLFNYILFNNLLSLIEMISVPRIIER